MRRTVMVEGETYRAGRNLNRRLRTQRQSEDVAAERERTTSTGRWDMSPADAETVKVDVTDTVVLMDRHTAYALIGARQGKLCVDLDTPVELIAVEGAA